MTKLSRSITETAASNPAVQLRSRNPNEALAARLDRSPRISAGEHEQPHGVSPRRKHERANA
jgi:hypothetical protein